MSDCGSIVTIIAGNIEEGLPYGRTYCTECMEDVFFADGFARPLCAVCAAQRNPHTLPC